MVARFFPSKGEFPSKKGDLRIVAGEPQQAYDAKQPARFCQQMRMPANNIIANKSIVGCGGHV